MDQYDYRNKYDNPRKAAVLSKYVKKAKQMQQTGCVNAPMLYKSLGPIFVPTAPNIGDARNAARFAIPNTKPY